MFPQIDLSQICAGIILIGLFLVFIASLPREK